MGFRDLARSFLDLVFGRNVGRGGPTASSARDAILNNKPLPTARVGNGPPPLPNRSTAVPPPVPGYENGMYRPGNYGALPALPSEKERFVGRMTPAGSTAITGYWVNFQSTWIMKAIYLPYTGQMEDTNIEYGDERGELIVTFLSYATVKYHNVKLSVWVDLYNAPSKGRYLYGAAIRRREPWTQGYTLVAPPSRKVTAALRQVNG